MDKKLIKMKEWFYILGFFAFVFILGSNSKVFAGYGTTLDFDGYHVWHSTVIREDITSVMVASGTIFIKQIKIESTGTAKCGLFDYDYSSPTYAHFVTSFSMSNAGRDPNYDITVTSGIVMNCSGDTTDIGFFTILFDWVSTSLANYREGIR